jgi:hypothetical protein
MINTSKILITSTVLNKNKLVVSICLPSSKEKNNSLITSGEKNEPLRALRFYDKTNKKYMSF